LSLPPGPRLGAVLSYGDRSRLCKNPIAKQLLTLMEKKRTNLCVSADVTTCSELLALTDAIGPYICALKTHVDILEDFTPDVITKLSALARRHGFLIFEDRKFADIGNTALLQYTKGVYRIAEWAHIVNAHPVPGPGIVKGLKQAGLPVGRALLLLAEMSSEGALATGSYTAATVDMAQKNADFVIGFVCQRRLCEDPQFVYFTPGVSSASEAKGKKGDSLGQQYNTPDVVVRQRHCDVIIVGRTILEATDRVATCKELRAEGWTAYEKRLADGKTLSKL